MGRAVALAAPPAPAHHGAAVVAVNGSGAR